MSARGTRRRRAGRAAALAAVLLAAPWASAQEKPPLPEVPAGAATLRGRVVHADQRAIGAGIEVALYALAADGSPSGRHATTDSEGRFVFEGLAAGPDVVYLVGARYAGIPFPGDRVQFPEGATEREIEIVVSDPSADVSQVRVLRSSVRLSVLGDRLAVSETHRLRNEGTRVVSVPPAARAGSRAPLHAQLLPGAREFAMPLGLVPEGVERDGATFRFWGPLYPGEQEISFRYQVPVAVGEQTLAKGFPSGADHVRIVALEGGLLEGASDLEGSTAVEDEGLRLRAFEGRDVARGFVTRVRLRIPAIQSDAGAVTLAESQLVLEIDDVTLQVKEQHRIEVAGTAMQQSGDGRPLVRFALPEGAEDVRFSSDVASLGPAEAAGGIGLVGPLPPGSHGIGIAYALRSGPEGVRFERHFDRRLPLLRVLVADTGVVVETDRLHRRRPERHGDRLYLVYEAFEIEGEEALHFGLRALPPRVASRRPAVVAALVLGLVALAVLLAPLRGGASEEAVGEEAETPASREEREHLYASIRDLDHDYETGKVDEASWQALRGELRARAVALLAEERDAPPRPEAEPDPTCKACQSPRRPGDRFCANCGQPLGAEARGA